MKTAFSIVVSYFLILGPAAAFARPYTLYRTSPNIGGINGDGVRIHIATFDTTDGDAYNKENCEIAAALFQRQPNVRVRYWCELGTYRK